MATNGCTPVHFVCFNGTNFYFTDAQPDLVEDAFRKSDCAAHLCLIRSNNNKFLILNAEKEFKALTLSGKQQCQPECKFNLQFYFDDNRYGKKGRAVILYATTANGKMKMVSCNERDEIDPEEMELPTSIGEDAHRAVFYRTEVSTSKYTLESSMYPNKFLGFKNDEDDHTLSKLVLIPVGKDEVDDDCELNFSPKS